MSANASRIATSEPTAETLERDIGRCEAELQRVKAELDPYFGPPPGAGTADAGGYAAVPPSDAASEWFGNKGRLLREKDRLQRERDGLCERLAELSRRAETFRLFERAARSQFPTGEPVTEPAVAGWERGRPAAARIDVTPEAGDDATPAATQSARRHEPTINENAHTVTMPDGQLIRVGGIEAWELFVKLWNARPSPVDVQAITGRDGREAISDLKRVLKQAGGHALANAIRNQRGVGYYLDFTTVFPQ